MNFSETVKDLENKHEKFTEWQKSAAISSLKVLELNALKLKNSIEVSKLVRLTHLKVYHNS